MIATFAVATGEIVAPMIRKHRKEEDFAEHIAEVVARAPQAEYIFVLDNLNIHKSEALVRYIAKAEGMDTKELGQKERKGIPAYHGLEGVVSNGSCPSNPVCIHTKALFVAEPDRMLVWNHHPPVMKSEGQLCIH